MNQYTNSTFESQDSWYYAYLVDDVPQRLPADNANGYTGPFDTEREAWLSLYAEMTAHIEELSTTNRVMAKGLKAIADYALPVAGGKS
jgi:hypothetical protein